MPQTLTEIKEELAARGIRPKHTLGQNFLHDHNQLRKLVAAAALPPGALVLEVGPGTGTLTETLLDDGCEVIACELDRDMAAIVQARNAHRMGVGSGRLTLVEADCLDGKHAISAQILSALAGRPFTLVANLPYQAATPLIATLLERHPECRGQFVTIQREVGERLMAKASSDAYGPISVMMELLADVEQIAVLSPGCFWPAPKVTSAMLAIRPRNRERPCEPWEPFTAFVQQVFGKRRKQLGAILNRESVTAAGFDPMRRPETLTPTEWVHLFRAFSHPS
ncbi:MAG: ribosomal RNA small subunit methyltransferase A [Planctomycetota bacterium]|nr:MAG: ribosomal RNA small subunit methyltransferase A [Planctomycetota bacterium]